MVVVGNITAREEWLLRYLMAICGHGENDSAYASEVFHYSVITNLESPALLGHKQNYSKRCWLRTVSSPSDPTAYFWC